MKFPDHVQSEFRQKMQGGEPPPNGDRINCGIYGNTAQASKPFVRAAAGTMVIIR